MENELLRSHDGHVTRLTLNRPDKANALSASLVEALINAIEYACTDGTRLMMLEGNGNHFCAGFDFTGYLEASEGDLVLRVSRLLASRLRKLGATVLFVKNSTEPVTSKRPGDFKELACKILIKNGVPAPRPDILDANDPAK